MVRLRSERWFAREGQRKARTQVASQNMATRKLISLCFLLALVIMLMQKAADPRMISNAFRSLGVPLEDAAAEHGTAVSEPRNAASPQPPAAKTRWQTTCEDLVPRLLRPASSAQIDALSVRCFQLDQPVSEAEPFDGGASERLRAFADSSLEHLEEIAQSIPGDAEGWVEQLDRFRDEWSQLMVLLLETGPAIAEMPVNAILQAALTSALDERLIQGMRDGSPWIQTDHVAFERLLQRTQQPPPAEAGSAKRVATQELDSAGNPLKGQLVRYRCSLRRMEFVEQADAAKPNGYWSLWVRGEDGSPQPVAIYSAAPAAAVLAEWTSVESGRYPEAEVTAWVGKRLAYGSEAGLEIAPTLFAAQLRITTPPLAESVPRVAQVKQAASTAILWGIVGAICLLVPILVNWRRSAKRGLGRAAKLLVLSASILATGSCMAWQEQPPWAVEDDPDAQWDEVYRSRIETTLSQLPVEAVEDYVRGNRESLPDEVLQLMLALDRLNWSKALRRASPLRVENGESELVLEPAVFSGYARLAVPVVLTEDQRAWYERTPEISLYRADIELPTTGEVGEGEVPGSSRLAPLICQRLPQIWTQSAQLRQPLVVEGMALRLGADRKLVCILSEAVQWRPRMEDADGLEPKLPSHLLALGSLGWDLTWLDEVRANNERALQAAESEAFYTFLGCLREARAFAPGDAAIKPLDALAEPAAAVGKRVEWPVRIVSGALVTVDKEEDIQQLGTNRYYQFDGFVELGSQRIRYRVNGEDLLFDGEFPITIVAAEDNGFGPPAGSGGGANARWDVGRYARLDGRFYRLWSFDSDFVKQHDARARQTAPLVVATELTASTAPAFQRSASEIGWFGYGLCGATLAILGAILWLTMRREPPRQRFS